MTTPASPEAGLQRYRVGGCVRDELLGLPIKDRDWVVVGATAEEMVARGFRPVGRDFPVFLHPESGEEHALARTERKSAPGHTGFVCHAAPDVTLEEDLRRRDFTVNAMAEADDGALIDPYGGQADLQRGVLRHISPAFSEDPLRVLRGARFAARFGFTLAPETATLMREIVTAGELDTLTPERVWNETRRALAGERPADFFRVLRDCGALAVVFPEIDALFGVPQPPKHHPEIDSGVHTLLVLEQAARLSADPAVRFAALVHDLGKATTPKQELPRHIAHEARGVPLVEALCDRLRVPNGWRELAVAVTRHHLLYHRAAELRPATVLKLLNQLDAFRRPQRFEDFLLACEADSRGRPGYEMAEFEQPRLLRDDHAAASAVDPRSVVADGLQGAAIREELERRRERAIAERRSTAM